MFNDRVDYTALPGDVWEKERCSMICHYYGEQSNEYEHNFL